MEIQNDGTYPHFVPLSTLIIANTCTLLIPKNTPFNAGPHWNSWRGTHTPGQSRALPHGSVAILRTCSSAVNRPWHQGNLSSLTWICSLQLISALCCQDLKQPMILKLSELWKRSWWWIIGLFFKPRLMMGLYVLSTEIYIWGKKV